MRTAQPNEIAEYENINAIKDAIVFALHPEQVFLFGSFAKGTQNEESDYDFCVVFSDKRAESLCKLAGMAYFAAGRVKRNRPMDIIIRQRSVFAEAAKRPQSIDNSIATEGVCLYGNR